LYLIPHDNSQDRDEDDAIDWVWDQLTSERLKAIATTEGEPILLRYSYLYKAPVTAIRVEFTNSDEYSFRKLMLPLW
jgi:hypothetical protein